MTLAVLVPQPILSTRSWPYMAFLEVVVASDVGSWSLSRLLIADHFWGTLLGLPGGDAKLREESQGEHHFTVFGDAVDRGVYALFMT